MLKPVSTHAPLPAPMLAGVSAFAAAPAPSSGFLPNPAAPHFRNVSGADSSSAIARRFAASSEIYLAMSAGQSSDAGSAGGAGAPPASGGDGGDGFDPEVLCLLIEALKGKSSFVRDRAGETILRIGLAALPSLMALMNDEDSSVHKIAEDLILEIIENFKKKGGAVTQDVIQTLLALLEVEEYSDCVIRFSEKALRNIGSDAVPALLAMVDHPSWNVRAKAVKVLRSIGPVTPDVVPALVARLGDRSSDVREAAAGALGDIGPVTPNVVPALVELLADPAWKVRMRAAYALGEIGPAAGEAAPGLTALLSDEAPYVRIAAVDTLGRIERPLPPHAVPALVENYNTPIIDHLSHLNFHFAVKRLLVDNIGTDGIPVFIEMLEAESHEGPRRDWEFLSEIEGFAAAFMIAIERMAQAERSRLLRLLPEGVISQLFGNELADLQERIEITADIMARGFAMVLGLGEAEGISGSTAAYGTVTMGAPGQGHSLVLAQSLKFEIEPEKNDLIKVDGGSHPEEARAMLRSLGFIVPHEVGHIVQQRRKIEKPGIYARYFRLLDDEVRDQANELLIDGLALSIARRGHLDILPQGEEAEDAREEEAVRSYVELANLVLSRHAEGISPLGPPTFARMIAAMHEMAEKKYRHDEIVEGVRGCAERYWKAAVEGRDKPWVAQFVRLVRVYRKIFTSARRILI